MSHFQLVVFALGWVSFLLVIYFISRKRSTFTARPLTSILCDQPEWKPEAELMGPIPRTVVFRNLEARIVALIIFLVFPAVVLAVFVNSYQIIADATASSGGVPYSFYWHLLVSLGYLFFYFYHEARIWTCFRSGSVVRGRVIKRIPFITTYRVEAQYEINGQTTVGRSLNSFKLLKTTPLKPGEFVTLLVKPNKPARFVVYAPDSTFRVAG